jgi:hypothetical protein
MRKTFNLYRFAQTADQPRNLSAKPASPSSTTPAAAPASPIDLRKAVSDAKTIYTEMASDKHAAEDKINADIRERLSMEDRKEFNDEIMAFLASQYLSSESGKNIAADPSGLLEELKKRFDDEGLDAALWFVENVIRETSPSLLPRAQSMINAMSGDRFNLEDVGISFQSSLDDSVNLINKAAVKALANVISKELISDMLDYCASSIKMLGTDVGKKRFHSAMIDIASRNIPLFSRNDFLGSMAERQMTFMSYFVGMHHSAIENKDNEGQPIVGNTLHNFINKHFTISAGARPLGESYGDLSGRRQSDVGRKTREMYDDIDGGLSSHRLSDGKFAFQHLAENISSALSQNPPNKKAICVVSHKIAALAESQGSSGGQQISQIGGKDSNAVDFSNKGYQSENSSAQTVPYAAVSDAGQPEQILNAVRSKTDVLKQQMADVAQKAKDLLGDNNVVTNYFINAISRLDASSVNIEGWLAGNMHIESINGISPAWNRWIDQIRSIQVRKSGDKIAETGSFDIGQRSKVRTIDGIESKFVFDFERPSNLNGLFSKKTVEYSDPSGSTRSLPVPVYKAKFINVTFKDKVSAAEDFTISLQGRQVIKDIADIVKPASLTSRKSVSDDEKIDKILEVLKTNQESFSKGAATFKANISNNFNTLARMLRMNDTSSLAQIRGKNTFFSSPNSAPTFDQLLMMRSFLPTSYFLRMLVLISDRITSRHKVVADFTKEENTTINKFMKKLLDDGAISQDVYNAIESFKATPTAATANKTSGDFESWIKIMAQMILS